MSGAETLELIVKKPEFNQIIEFNYDELKEGLTKALAKYRGLTFLEDQIKDAKSDRARLNKLKDAFEEKFKELKRECLSPLADFERRIKELIALVDAPVQEIDKQIKTFEEKQRGEKRAEIAAIFAEEAKGISEIIKLERIFNERWLNVTFKISEVRKEISAKVDSIKVGLQTIDGFSDDVRAPMKTAFLRNLNLADAMEEKSRLDTLRAYEERKKAEAVEAAARKQASQSSAPAAQSPQVSPQRITPEANVSAGEEQKEPLEEITLCFLISAAQKAALREFISTHKIKCRKA